MRILEWILVLVTLVVAILMLVRPRRGMRMAMISALVLFTVLHGVIEQFRVQMLGSFGYDCCSTKESQITDPSHADFYHGIAT